MTEKELEKATSNSFVGMMLIVIGFALLLTLEEAVALGGGALGFLFFFGGTLAAFCGGSLLLNGTVFPGGDE